MKLEQIKDDVYWIEGYPRPVSNDRVCLEIAASNVDTLLVIDDDITPFCFRLPDGLWCYIRPLKNSESPTPAELVRITDFIEYERKYGRNIGIWIGYEAEKTDLVAHIREAETPEVESRPLPHDPCCCRPFHDGCRGELLCHGTTVDSAREILRSGRLLSKAKLSGMTDQQLSSYSRQENVGDPPDHYRHVCLANGDCVAPDIVTAARRKRTFVSTQQADEDFYPAVRFYFDTRELFQHQRAVWDGVCPLKIRDELELRTARFVVVAPKADQNGIPLKIQVASELLATIIHLDHSEHYGLTNWSTASFEAASQSL